MTDSEKELFKKNIFEPYSEAWEIMKKMRDTEPKDDKFWDDYTKKATEFPSKYGNSEISQSISRVLLDAGSEVSKIGRQN